MAFTIVLGLAALSVTSYGHAFEFSGLDQSALSKSQVKPTLKPFSLPSLKPFTAPTNQPQQAADHFKSVFDFKSAVAPKPFGAPYDPFKQSYQPYQQFGANYQPFGPFPGYPGPVVYPGYQQAPSPYAAPPPSYHGFNNDQKNFGFQPFSAPVQPTFSPSFKFGAPPKKFNKNSPSFAGDFNLPGKYFQEHQFGAYHGPEFSSAIVPAEHNIKQSKPKDTLLGKPIVPTFPEFGLTKQVFGGFAPPQSFAYPVPNFPQIQPFVSTLSPATSDSATSTTLPSQDDSATGRGSLDEQVTPSATPAADPQPAGPSSQEPETADESVNSTDKPATDAQQSEPSSSADGAESSAPADGVTSEPFAPVVVEDVKEESSTPAAAAAAESEADTGKSEESKSAEPEADTGKSEENKSAESTAAPAESSAAPAESSATPADTPVDTPVDTSADIRVAAVAPALVDTPAVSLPGLPNEVYATAGPLPASDPSSLAGIFGSTGLPYYGQSAGFQQPEFASFYDAPKFTDEELKLFAANFESTGLQPSQIFGIADPAVKITESAGPTENSIPSSSTPSSENVEKVEINENSAGSAKTENVENNQSGEKTEESGEKKEAGGSGSLESRIVPEAPKKSNTVQIVQDDVFNGQFPLLFDPSNTASPLDKYGFYKLPSVSALSSQATLASYSPEAAFSDFGTQFRQGYLVEGAPSLTPVTKTVVQTNQAPISIASADHPLHSQVFKYSQSFVPYPQVAAANNPSAFRSFQVSPSSTALPLLPSAAADATSTTNSAESVAVESSSSSSDATEKV